MENFITDIMYTPVATIWNEKIISAKKLVFVVVDMNILRGVEGTTWFGSPWVVYSIVVGVDIGLPVVELCVNVLLGLFLLLISVTSASTSNSSSEIELHLSSVKGGADSCDKCEPEFGDVGRGIRGVRGLYCAGGSIGTGVSITLTVLVCGGVELGQFPQPVCPLVVYGWVADCVDVGLGG